MIGVCSAKPRISEISPKGYDGRIPVGEQHRQDDEKDRKAGKQLDNAIKVIASGVVCDRPNEYILTALRIMRTKTIAQSSNQRPLDGGHVIRRKSKITEPRNIVSSNQAQNDQDIRDAARIVGRRDYIARRLPAVCRSLVLGLM